MSDLLHEDATPVDSDDLQDHLNEVFEPVEITDEMGADPLDQWEDVQLPFEWLFEDQGRRRLIAYAIEQIARGEELVYENKTHLSESADMSRHAVINHIEILVALNVYKRRGEKRPRYKPNERSRILSVVHTLNEEIVNQEIDPDEV